MSEDPNDQIVPPPPGVIPIGSGYSAPATGAPVPSQQPVAQATNSAIPPPPGVAIIHSSDTPGQQQSTEQPSFWKIAYERSGIPGAIELAKGANKGLNSTVYKTGDMISRGLGGPSFIDNPSIHAAITPTNDAQEVGQAAEQAAEYFAPAGFVGKAGKLVDAATSLSSARVLARAVMDGVANAGVAGMQTGGDPSAMTRAGVLAGGTSAVIGAAPKVMSSAMDAMFPNRNNPVVEQALQSVEPHVPMSVGQRTGSEQLQRVEQNLPGAQTFYDAQKEALADRGEELMGAGPNGTNPYGAGKDLVGSRLPDRITKLKGQADNLYDQVRSAAAANQQNVQTGVQTSPVLSPSGAPITTPVMQTFESPVDLQPIRTALSPVYQDLMRSMPVAKREASPAFTALADLMNSTDPQMNAMDFDKSLSAIKALARDGSSPYLTNKSQAIAKQIVGQGEQQLNQALAQAGPNVNAKLASARNIVKAYYNTADLLNDINSGEPAAVYSNLTTGGDRVVNTLQQLQKIAPKQVETIGQTYLQGLLDRSTKEGGFGRADGIAADWNRMGPETKQILFGSRTDALDNFMLAAKRLTKNANPSGTAKMLAALGPFGAGGTALYEALMGNPYTATGVGAAALGAKAASELLFNPQTLKAAANAMLQAARPGVAPSLAGAGTRVAEMVNQQQQPPAQYPVPTGPPGTMRPPQ